MPKAKIKQDASFKHLKLSAIKQVSPSVLNGNLMNSLFSEEKPADLSMMREDIKKRGILVPLVAKKDGTLLAGHRRLIIARVLNLKTVPVQYVEQKLSLDEEKLYIIGDNVFRRQISYKDRMYLYRQMYPELDDTIAMGVSAPGAVIKGEIVISKIARTLNIPTTTVTRDLGTAKVAYALEHKEKEDKGVNDQLVRSIKKLLTQLLIKAASESTETKRAVTQMIEDYSIYLKNVDKFTVTQLMNFSGSSVAGKQITMLASARTISNRKPKKRV